MATTYKVQGMTCSGCATALYNALQDAGITVEMQDISVESGQVTLAQDADPDTVKAAVQDAGFQWVG